MIIKVINPNTTWSMTSTIEAAARDVVWPGNDIVAVSPDMGPASIESHYDEALAVPGVLTEVMRADADAYVIACFGDPGLDAAREVTTRPVLGIAQAAMHAASMVGRSFSIVTTLARTMGRARDLTRLYGMTNECAGIHACEIAVLELESDPQAVDKIVGACAQALARDGSDCIVLGCAGMAQLCGVISGELGVPVVDGVAAAVTFGQSLAAMRLTSAGNGEWAYPLPKKYIGLLDAFTVD